MPRPDKAERRPLSTDGALKMTSSPATTIQDPDDIARLLAVSDERDSQLARLLAAERAAYDAGFADGMEAGRRLALGEESQQRREAAALVTGARPGRRYVSAAELDRRRYPPAGRTGWLLPGSGDAA